LAETDAAARALGAVRLTEERLARIEEISAACSGDSGVVPLSPLDQAELEDRVEEWLEGRGLSVGLAAALTDAGLSIEGLESLASEIPELALDPALRWIAARCATRSLALDIEKAASRIHELVSTVKRFTYMDTVSGLEAVEVGPGLRDTTRISAAKAREKGVEIVLDVADDLPRALANGGELNQVWMNLLDNALDAVEEGGHVDIVVRQEVDRILVRVVDDGRGIDPNALPFIFDPFFTTKPPGEGTGLGLDITRRLLRRFHGDISVESKPGRTEFQVSLRISSGEP
jgi:signal transduction histidine kinase